MLDALDSAISELAALMPENYQWLQVMKNGHGFLYCLFLPDSDFIRTKIDFRQTVDSGNPVSSITLHPDYDLTVKSGSPFYLRFDFNPKRDPEIGSVVRETKGFLIEESTILKYVFENWKKLPKVEGLHEDQPILERLLEEAERAFTKR